GEKCTSEKFCNVGKLKGGELKAEGNMFINNGCFGGSSGPHATVVVDAVDSNTVGDFGDAGGGLCVPFKGSCIPSTRGNAFCQDGIHSTTDIASAGSAQVSAGRNCWGNVAPPTISNLPDTVPTMPASLCTEPGFMKCP